MNAEITLPNADQSPKAQSTDNEPEFLTIQVTEESSIGETFGQ